LYGFHLLAPFPGTEIRERSEELGIKVLTDDWSQYHANRAIVETPAVSHQMMNDIVIKWEEDFDGWLEYIKLRMDEGEATEYESSLRDGLEQTVLIYDLMMGHVIEDKGAWPTNGKPVNDQDCLNTLVHRVGDVNKTPREQVHRILQRAFKKGDLSFQKDGGKIRWAWSDYL
jgi:hypothetical protein